MKDRCPFCDIPWSKIRQNNEVVGQKYRLRKIIGHLEDHGMDFGHAFFYATGKKIPLCACGCGNRVKPLITGKVRIPKILRSHIPWNKGVTKNDNEKMKNLSINRMGDGNPMFGKMAWNNGLTKETCESIMSGVKKRIGTKASPESRIKMSESAKKRLIHGHTGHFHSPETIDKLRRNTAKLISEGIIYKDSPSEDMFAVFLEEFGIEFRRQKYVEYFSFDFYLPEFNAYVEIDDDWLHCNGIEPKTKMQKRVYRQDGIKNEYCRENKMKLIRLWNSQITWGGARECIRRLESKR